jgi:hypothetical protein
MLLTLPVPAFSDNFGDTIRNYLGGGTGYFRGRVRLSDNQALIQSNLRTRDTQLRAEINRDVAAGTLSTGSAESLSSQLDRIASMRDSYINSQGGLTTDQTNRLVSMLGDVTTNLNSLCSTGRSRDWYPGYRRDHFGAGAPVGDIAMRQRMLRRRLERAAEHGSISTDEASLLEHQLDRVSDEASEPNANQSWKLSALQARLDRIEQRLQNDIAAGPSRLY